MTRIIKFALVWFITLALPIQGFAAVTMLCCGSSQVISPIVHVQHESQSGLEFAVAVVDQEKIVLRATEDHHGVLTTPGVGEADHVVATKQAGSTTCEVCAATCSGVAVMPEILDALPSPDSLGLTVVAGFYSSDFKTHISGTPQRPPL